MSGLLDLLDTRDICSDGGKAMNEIKFLNFYLMCSRLHYEKRTYDPIDYECIDRIDFWIVKEEPPSKLDMEEVEVVLYQEDVIPIIEKSRKGTCTQDDLEEENDSELNVLENITLESFSIVSPNNFARSNVGKSNFMKSNPQLIVTDESGSDDDET
ncbi:hypothetical protein GH714_022331 [Hevea brasiliensis]|uniref:DUF4216 domain-containing protein n=1 Tax=Hevea brasiliensis TaxID=3981 RepID=A0A6A6M8L7_HEVBR|nr:hypothetical protein GH714_022331 [Hevea brasiliensis]